MSTITFDLIGTRTADDLYKDTAIVNGYEETITETTEYTNETTVPDNAYDVKEYTQEDGTILYSYKIDTEITNPESDIDFGKKLTEAKFGLEDSELAGKATTIRAKKEYNI